MNAERSRLEDKRAQLLLKREAAQAELGRFDRAVQATDEHHELLAALLAGNGSESAAAGDGSNAEAEAGGSGSKGGKPTGDGAVRMTAHGQQPRLTPRQRRLLQIVRSFGPRAATAPADPVARRALGRGARQ